MQGLLKTGLMVAMLVSDRATVIQLYWNRYFWNCGDLIIVTANLCFRHIYVLSCGAATNAP